LRSSSSTFAWSGAITTIAAAKRDIGRAPRVDVAPAPSL
jgi:hypothetical protein